LNRSMFSSILLRLFPLSSFSLRSPLFPIILYYSRLFPFPFLFLPSPLPAFTFSPSALSPFLSPILHFHHFPPSILFFVCPLPPFALPFPFPFSFPFPSFFSILPSPLP